MIGQTLAHYRILEKIGAGGMGEVYRAHDERLDRDVALKVLPTEVSADAAARERLLREARTASQLNHPNICTIYEVGEAGGQAYIAMELVEGRPLDRMIPSDGFPVEAVVRYAVQLADALAHAHQRSIIHRDLKTANVVVTPEGRAKILDFGLARRVRTKELEDATRSKVSLEEAGGISGTLAYMAPEVLRGEEADARSDLWALGVMLHEMASGARPYQGRTGFELSSAILHQPAAELPEKVSPGLRAVVERCLAKVSAQRYQTAGEVRAGLEAGILDTRRVPAVPAKRGRRPPRAGRIRSLAVLPLENLSRDPEQDYFADGMTEELITQLAKLGVLRVISRTSVMMYKGARKPLPEIARELGVDAVIEGSVLRAGERVRITVQLIHAATDTHLWAESYERDLRDVLTLQNDLTWAIVGELRGKLTPQQHARLGRAKPVDPEAHELYLRGRYFYSRFTPDDLAKSLECFERAATKDPSYAPAYAGMADVHVLWAWGLGGRPPREFLPQARMAAQNALDLDETLPDAHVAMAMTHLAGAWDWASAEREFRRAVELNRNSVNAHYSYSILLSALARHGEALAEAMRAAELDPLSLLMKVNVGWRYQSARQYDKAVEHFQKVLEMEPSFYVARENLARTYIMQGRYAEAIAELRDIQFLPTSWPSRITLARAYALSGDRAAGLKLRAEIEDIAKQTYVPGYWLALLSAAFEEKERALDSLERAYEDRDTWLVLLRFDSGLDVLRNEPRFQALLRKMNFPP